MTILTNTKEHFFDENAAIVQIIIYQRSERYIETRETFMSDGLLLGKTTSTFQHNQEESEFYSIPYIKFRKVASDD